MEVHILKNILNILLRPIKATVYSFSRFPITTVYLFLLFAFFSFMVQYENLDSKLTFSIIFCAVFGALLNMILVASKERINLVKKYWYIALICGVIAPVILYLILHFTLLDDLMKVRVIILNICLLISFLLIPCYKSQKFNINNTFLITVKAAFISFIYGLALFLALLFLATSIKGLLWNDMSEKVFAHIAVFSGFVTTVFFTGYFPLFNDEQDDERFITTSRVTLFIEVLISYIIIPVLLAFTLVFLGYAAKIIILWDWPKNQFALYSSLYILFGLIIYFFASNIENAFSRFYRFLFPKLLILVVGLQSISIFLRVFAYGLTEKRYYLILFWVFALFCSIWFSIKPIKKNQTAPIVLICLLILSVLPIINFSETSIFSQVIRAESILKKNEMLIGGNIKANSNINKEDKQQITDILRYLDEKQKLSNINWLPKEFSLDKTNEYFGFSIDENNVPQKLTNFTYILEEISIPISDYEFAIKPTKEFSNNLEISNAAFIGKKGNYYFELLTDHSEATTLLTLKLNDKVIITSDLNNFFENLKNDYSVDFSNDNNIKENAVKKPFSKMFTVLEGEGSKLLIVFNSINYNQITNSKYDLIKAVDFTFELYFKE